MAGTRESLGSWGLISGWLGLQCSLGIRRGDSLVTRLPRRWMALSSLCCGCILLTLQDCSGALDLLKLVRVCQVIHMAFSFLCVRLQVPGLHLLCLFDL